MAVVIAVQAVHKAEGCCLWFTAECQPYKLHLSGPR
jgi:hypothetical protein